VSLELVEESSVGLVPMLDVSSCLDSLTGAL
jgi:hypothetical protein